MNKNYNWACIGCGHIADEMAKAMKQLNKTFYSLASRTKVNADAFASKYGIDKVYDNIDDVFTDENVDIIYIATPHNSHIEYILKALNAGKHVICEKAITLNSNELKQAVELAEKNNVVLAEAMTIFHMPVYRKIDEVISSGKLGKLKLIQVNLGSCKDYDMTNRFFNME
ncbi:MAG: Gfo/Idh/MocA family oxidoreductase, partial [Eubacterium sp.]|nr:Gfo/Idh/MocA family oxidoreductase [Eubacterium sp.]